MLALLAGSALAQRAERPEVRIGDRWQFVVYYASPSTTPNRAWVTTSVAATGIEGTENGEPLRMTLELNVLESPQGKESNPKSRSFPLEVGRRWRYASDWVFKPKGSSGNLVTDVAIVAHEKVSVPAGDFEAFKLVAKSQVGGTSPIGSQYNAEITTPPTGTRLRRAPSSSQCATTLTWARPPSSWSGFNCGPEGRASGSSA